MAAQRGIDDGCSTLGVAAKSVVLKRVAGTHVDTTEGAMRVAAFMATARLFDRDEDFEPTYANDNWTVGRT